MAKGPVRRRSVQVHATCVALDGRGVLIRGPSGSGKSDLALRLIEGGARLVADDRVVIAARDGSLAARAPPALKGRIEVRGLGIVEMEAVSEAPLALVVDLAVPAEIDRLPAPARAAFHGIALPRLAIAPFEASAAAKVRLAVGALSRDSTARS